jgi:hypothetical protein
VADTLTAAKVDHAATGLSAAWQLTRFAGFAPPRSLSRTSLSPDLRGELGFRGDVRGANLWLVVPNDAGVFQGPVDRDGIRCVHPVQAYLDLEGHPERASEAAERVRAEFLHW